MLMCTILPKEVSAIVVARKGSVRIPNKNEQLLSGEPLFLRKIKQLQKCKNIHRVIFGSDSEQMLSAAKGIGAEVIKRPDFFCDERVASANDMIQNMVSSIETDIVVWAHCTNPLISSETYDKAVEVFFQNYGEYDSLLSVVKLQEHLWHEDKGKFVPLNYNPYAERHIAAKDLPPYYMQDGGIFIQPHKQMKANRYFFGNRPYLFLVSPDEFLDINTERDLMLARAILGKQIS